VCVCVCVCVCQRVCVRACVYWGGEVRCGRVLCHYTLHDACGREREGICVCSFKEGSFMCIYIHTQIYANI